MSLLFGLWISCFGFGRVEVALFTICKNGNFMEHLICQSWVEQAELWSSVRHVKQYKDVNSASTRLPACDHVCMCDLSHAARVCVCVPVSVANCLQNI